MAGFGRKTTESTNIATEPIKAEAGVALPSQTVEEASPAIEIKVDANGNKEKIYALLMEQIDLNTASKLPREDLKRQIIDLIGEIVIEQKFLINHLEQQILAGQIIDDMLGLGPLEPLLNDESITDIMVNGANQVYVERKGKLTLTEVKFRDDKHVMSIAQRIVTAVGRRVDESSPICDARLMDGSRVNVIAPPLAIKGCSISIRKFSKKKITLDIMASQKNISDNVCKVLKIAGAVRLNVIISGGTGSGRTGTAGVNHV
ncbi:MAG: ATPase, T2SS/T4P/T4SS family, partial [Pseudomonadota bacterium]